MRRTDGPCVRRVAEPFPRIVRNEQTPSADNVVRRVRRDQLPTSRSDPASTLLPTSSCPARSFLRGSLAVGASAFVLGTGSLVGRGRTGGRQLVDLRAGRREFERRHHCAEGPSPATSLPAGAIRSGPAHRNSTMPRAATAPARPKRLATITTAWNSTPLQTAARSWR